MSFTSTLILFNMATFATSIGVCIYGFPIRQHVAIRLLMILALSFSLIAVCTQNVYVLDDEAAKIFFSRMRFIGICLLPPCWLLFFSAVFERAVWLLRPPIAAAIFLIPAITISMTVVPMFRDLVVTNFQPYEAYGLSVLKFQGGAWFPIHIVTSYAFIILSLILGLWIYFKGNGQQRPQTIILMLGCFIASAFDAYCVVTNSDLRWVMASAGIFFLTQLSIVYTAYRYRLLDIVPFAMEKIFYGLPDPVVVQDQRGIVRAVNPSTARVFGLKNPVGRFCAEVFPNLNLDKNDFSFVDKAGKERFFDVSTEMLDVVNGIPTGQVLIFHEVTEAKNTQRSLNDSLEFKARLLSLIAHDLSGNMKNQTLLLSTLRNQIQPEYQELATILTDSSSASQGLMANILSWARLQEAKFVPIRKPFELLTLIRDCVEAVEISARMAGVSIDVLAKQPLIFNGDSEMLGSVIRNLLMNSIRATQSGKRISVDFTTDYRSVEICIQDQGRGMSPDQIQELLNAPDKFFAPRKSSDGYGIGLVISRRFMELHDGVIGIDSDEGRGTRVTLSIPL